MITDHHYIADTDGACASGIGGGEVCGRPHSEHALDGRRLKPRYRFKGRLPDAYPVDYYVFELVPPNALGNYLVPVDMFWGRVPWK